MNTLIFAGVSLRFSVDLEVERGTLWSELGGTSLNAEEALD